MRRGACLCGIMRKCAGKLRKNTWPALTNGWKNRSKVAWLWRVMAALASKAKARWISRMRSGCTTGTFFITRQRFHLRSAESKSARGVSRRDTKMCFSADRAPCEVALLAAFLGITRRRRCLNFVERLPMPENSTSQRADPRDVGSIDAIIAAAYDVISGPAGQKRDWNRERSLFFPVARIMPTASCPGSNDVELEPQMLDVVMINDRADPILHK